MFYKNNDEIASQVVSRKRFYPFPVFEDREAWTALPADRRDPTLAEAERYENYEWPRMSASEYMAYYESGDRSGYQRLYEGRRGALGTLVLGECIEGHGRFLPAIIDGIWCICEESSWVPPWHNNGNTRKRHLNILPNLEDSFIDLSAGGTGAFMAWVHYFLRGPLDRISPIICRRIRHEVSRRIIRPYIERSDFWWMGYTNDKVNNWNPWCNANILTALLILEQDESSRRRGITKVIDTLGIYLDTLPSDGGCDEGPAYWIHAAGSVFEALELLRVSSQEGLNLYDQPLIQAFGTYIYKVYIHGDSFVNFADAPARIPDVPGHLIALYGDRIGDARMMALGERFRRINGPFEWSTSHPLRSLLELFEPVNAERVDTESPLVSEAWLSDLQVMIARQHTSDPGGLFLAVKGGHNGENHNHNDVGQFIVYYDGSPFVVDPGVGIYTAKTFGNQRYEIWTMQSAFHNLPTIRGQQQQVGTEFAAQDVRFISQKQSDGRSRVSFDIAGAYPPETGLLRWVRTLELRRPVEKHDSYPASIEVVEDFELAEPTNEIGLSLVTRWEPLSDGDREIYLRSTSGLQLGIHILEGDLEFGRETIDISDKKLAGYWGERLYRIVFHPKTPIARARWHYVFVPGRLTPISHE